MIGRLGRPRSTVRRRRHPQGSEAFLEGAPPLDWRLPSNQEDNIFTHEAENGVHGTSRQRLQALVSRPVEC